MLPRPSLYQRPLARIWSRRTLCATRDAYAVKRQASITENEKKRQRRGAYLRNPKTLSVVGAPLCAGQRLLGVDKGPQMLREGGLIDELRSLEWQLEDLGDLDFGGSSADSGGGGGGGGGGGDGSDGADATMDPALGVARHSSVVGPACEQLRDHVRDHASEGKFVLVLGGDHSIAAGSVAGAAQARAPGELGVIWIDAHADLNVPETSPSGNMHGMPLSFLLGLVEPAAVPGFEWLPPTTAPVLRPEQIVYIGLRDVDAVEKRTLRRLGIKAFSMQHVDRYGIGQVVDFALDHLGPERPLHMSYDIDAVDPAWAPSTGTVVRGGLTFREANYVAEAVSDTGRLVSMDMVEVNPDLDHGDASNADATVQMGLALVSSALGSRIL